MSMNAKKQWAAVYSNDKVICVQTNSGLRVAGLDPAGKQIFFSSNDTSEVLGHGLLQALDASRVLELDEVRQFFDPINLKQRYEDWVSRLLQHVGSDNRKGLFENMKYCSVECENDLISIRPTAHDESESWVGIPGAQLVRVSRHASTDEVGQGILLALSLSKN